MTPATLVHIQPELVHKYARDAQRAGPCAAPVERKWAGLACIVLLGLAPMLIALSA
jgi:hypothetical protein